VVGISQTFGKALSPGVSGAIQRRFIREGFGLRFNPLPFRLYHFGSGGTRGPGAPGPSPALIFRLNLISRSGSCTDFGTLFTYLF